MARDGSPDREAGADHACIREWIFLHGEAPTVRQIGHAVGLASPSSVDYQPGRLEQLGLISRSHGR